MAATVSISSIAARLGVSYSVAYRRSLLGEFGRLMRVGKGWAVVSPEPDAPPPEQSNAAGELSGLLEACRTATTLLETVTAFRDVPGSELSPDEAAAVEDFPQQIADALDRLSVRLAEFHLRRQAQREAAPRRN